MRFEETKLAGCYLIKLEPHGDERGYFARTFCTDEFDAQGLNTHLSQASVSYNQDQGTVRGMHFQNHPHSEDKLIRCLRGAIFDVVVDVRLGSLTFGQWVSVELTDSNCMQLYAPRGFAHGFQTLSDDCLVSYHIAQSFVADSANGISWCDPKLAIDWPLQPRNLSEMDQQRSNLCDVDTAFLTPFERV